MRVTVGVTSFNNASYIEEALTSIFANDAELQVIVVDNASTDDTDSIVERFPVTYIKHEVNSGGPTLGRQEVIAAATGDYLVFVDADDALAYGAIDYLLTQPHADWRYTDMLLMNEKSIGTDLWTYEGWPTDASEGLRRARATLSMPVPLHSAILSMDFLRRNDLTWFDNAAQWGEDTTTAIEFLRHGPSIAYVPGPLFKYRVHPGMGSIAEAHRRPLFEQSVREQLGGI